MTDRKRSRASLREHPLPPDSQLVVIGASAGGIEALSRVVASLPADFSVPIVIAQHLDPRRPSHLREILARQTPLPVRTVTERTSLKPGVVYVVPSNRHVELMDHEVRLRQPTQGSIAPSVDVLLESASRAYGAGLIAVILTGSGSDGSVGARQVKLAGGTVVIENPATAMFPSMPSSIPPFLVDATADLEGIGPLLHDLLSVAAYPKDGTDREDLNMLLARLHERSGIDFSSYKPATILRRLKGRMTATASPTVTAYAAHLETEPEEYARLVSSLLIKVTEFFRDAKVWDYLRDKILPGLIDESRTAGRELRVWSAGCATGEEAYSLAINVAEALDGQRQPVEVRIFATDIDRDAIAFARRGIYPAASLASLPPAVRDRYFTRTDGSYEVGKRLRSLVVFGEPDLGERAPFPRIDLLLCRNVLIYFAPPMQRATLETFAYSLRPEGCLVLGPSETVAALPAPFSQEHARLCIYRRRPGTRLVLPVPRAPQLRRGPLEQAIRATRLDVQRASASAVAAEGLLLDLAVGVVVVNPDYDIVRINSAARRLLGIHGTAFDQDFIHLAESLPAAPLRAAIDAALTGSTTTADFEIDVASQPGIGARYVEARFSPQRGDSPTIEGAVIELTDVSRFREDRSQLVRTQRRTDRALVANARLLDANEELTALVARLRSSNEAILLSSEDAQSSREEIETLNEEFQATNEELETLNEELTASVEELRVSNESLETRTVELSVQTEALKEQKRASAEEQDRLRSIFASLGDAVVAVDETGAVVATNATYDRLFGGDFGDIIPEDLAGVPLPPKDRPRQRAARGERFRMEFAITTKDGSRRWFEAVAEPLTGQQRSWSGVLAIRDVSDRTMRLSLERLMAAAGHELKTPMAALHGYLQLIERSIGSAGSANLALYTTRALAQTRGMGALVERLFDVSRIQSGQLELVIGSIDLVDVVHGAIDVSEGLREAPPIKLSAPRSLRLNGDAGRLEQVLINILGNAVEHAAETPTIDVSVRRSGRSAIVVVRDHGPGIGSAELPHVFQPYVRLGRRQSAGLGLGLFLAREIVTAHGGTIEIASRRRSGTTITVRLPIGGPNPRAGVKGRASDTS
ncbi:MAG TPA: CheR family methyltransferase [Candidatus Limnocylindrales bacterium]|nr:CheR family methyltransferase [Candidatus Limnocylindrales bacterium]